MRCPPGVTSIVQKAGKPSIQSLLLEEIAAYLAAQNQRPYRANQIADWIYQKRVNSFDEMTDLPHDLRHRLAEDFAIGGIETVRILGSDDTTRKFLFRLPDGNLIESVLIPASPALYGERSDRRTICVSTQVGCAYGCKFCASGLDGYTRNLEASEIVQQLLEVERKSGEKIFPPVGRFAIENVLWIVARTAEARIVAEEELVALSIQDADVFELDAFVLLAKCRDHFVLEANAEVQRDGARWPP